MTSSGTKISTYLSSEARISMFSPQIILWLSILHRSEIRPIPCYCSDEGVFGHALNMKDGVLSTENGPFIGDDDWQRLEKYWMRNGDMIMGRKGDMSNLIFVRPEYDRFLIGSDCIRFRVDPLRVSQRYFFHFLRSETTQNWIQGQAYGTVMPGINEKILGRLLAYVPPLREQVAIAAEFDDIELSLSRNSERVDQSLALKSSLLRETLRNSVNV